MSGCRRSLRLQLCLRANRRGYGSGAMEMYQSDVVISSTGYAEPLSKRGKPCVPICIIVRDEETTWYGEYDEVLLGRNTVRECVVHKAIELALYHLHTYEE